MKDSDFIKRMKAIEKLSLQKCESSEPVKCDEMDACRVCNAVMYINHFEQELLQAERDLGLKKQ